MRKRPLILAGLLLVAAPTAATALPAEAPARPVVAAEAPAGTLEGLRILVVNDDSVQGSHPSGRDGLGLYALRSAMCAAGADVVTVGPWAVQSGQGGRISLSGSATVQQVTPPAPYAGDCGEAPSGGAVFGVCSVAGPCTSASASASPSDAARLALTRFLPDNYWADGPDLVLSGINYGQNDSVSVIHSGTVNAATVSHHLGVPAIAFSEELNLACARGDLTLCPEFTGAADFGVDLVAGLREDGLLTPDLFLNINYPHLAEGETAGEPVLNVLGDCGALNFGFNGPVGAAGGTYSVGVVPPCQETRRNADTTALEHDRISVVSLTGDGSDPTPDGRVTAVVRGLGD